MNDEDVKLFRQAEGLAQSGQTLLAYQIFRQLHDRGSQDVNVLVGIAYTTADADEAREAIAVIRQMQPHHPQLKSLESLHRGRLMSTTLPPGPVLLCPYCSARMPARVKWKISVGGVVWFAAFFLLFLACELVIVPTIAQAQNMSRAAFFFLIIGIIGLFAIRKRTYACGHCSSKIADAH